MCLCLRKLDISGTFFDGFLFLVCTMFAAFVLVCVCVCECECVCVCESESVCHKCVTLRVECVISIA